MDIYPVILKVFPAHTWFGMGKNHLVDHGQSPPSRTMESRSGTVGIQDQSAVEESPTILVLHQVILVYTGAYNHRRVGLDVHCYDVATGAHFPCVSCHP